LQVKRKPVAIDITEDGFLLAVLSRPSQVDLYEIHGEGDNQIKKRRTIMLVHEASSIVISPDARILITGNKFGIEVIAIGPEVPETTRRTLSGPAGDALEFSDDGRTLLITGYARKSDGSALFVLPGLYDGPLTEEGEPIPQPPEAAWTGSVLFPETARIARQATLLPDADTGTFNELFAFNAEEDSWGHAQSSWTMLCLPCLPMLILQRWLCGCAGPPISGFTKYRVGSTSRVRRLRWMLLFSLAFASRSPMTTQVLCRRSVC
jgi:hypothetical protein